MSIIDKIRSFAKSRCGDHEVVDDGITYGNCREVAAEIARLEAALTREKRMGQCLEDAFCARFEHRCGDCPFEAACYGGYSGIRGAAEALADKDNPDGETGGAE